MSPKSRYSKGAQRREEILEAAFEVLARDGYRGASLGQIGRAIGIDSAHIIYYFDTRDDLLQEVLRRWDAIFDERHSTSDDALAVWEETVRSNAEHPGMVQLYSIYAAESADPAHPAHAYFLERFAKVQGMLVDEVRRRQGLGIVSAEVDPVRTATALLSLSDGLQLRWLVDRSLDMRAALRAGIEDLLGPAPTV